MFAPTADPSLARRLIALAASGTWAVARGASRIVRAYLNRRVAMGMMEFDERMLKDIGITRGDVHASIVSPSGGDPTARLRILAVERRAASRAAASERLRLERELTATLDSERRTVRGGTAAETC